MYCGSVRRCQFDSFWVPFNTTNRAVRVAWITLNAKLTFLGFGSRSPTENVSYSFIRGGFNFAWATFV